MAGVCKKNVKIDYKSCSNKLLLQNLQHFVDVMPVERLKF